MRFRVCILPFRPIYFSIWISPYNFRPNSSFFDENCHQATQLKNMNKITRFLWFCSVPMLPYWTRHLLKPINIRYWRYCVFTGLLAAVSAFMHFIPFSNLYGMHWFWIGLGLMIFNLTGSLFPVCAKGTMPGQSGNGHTKACFAVLLAVVISRPLELKILKEINRKLDQKTDDRTK